MKKAVSMLLVMCMLVALCACSDEGASASPGEPNSSSSGGSDAGVVEVDGKLKEPSQSIADSNRFYDARVAETLLDFGYYTWNSDGSVWVQDLNTIQVIDRNNRLLRTIELNKSDSPASSRLVWNESKILSIRNASEESANEFGAVYQVEGKLYLCGVSVWDLDGNLIKEYPSFPLQNSDGTSATTTPDGTKMDWWQNFHDVTPLYWLDDHTFAVNGHSRVIIYDLDSDTGRVVDDMVELIEKHGKFSVYYGVDANSCYVNNGNFYYMAHKNEEKSNIVGTILRAGKDDTEAAVMFGGKEFSHLFMDGSTMLLTEIVEQPQYGMNLWWADAEQGVLHEMGFHTLQIPIVIDDRRAFMLSDTQELLCYDLDQPAENPLTVAAKSDSHCVGTRLSRDGNLELIFNESNVAPVYFYKMNAKTGEKVCIYEGSTYDKLLLSPDKNYGIVLHSREEDNSPQVKILSLEG